jgi:hypothetical protein
MQPDFSKMAQGQAKPTEQPQEMTPEVKQQTAGFLKQLPTMEAMGKQGLPTGESKEDIKSRILSMLQSLGLMEMFDTPAKQQELASNLDALVTAYETDDIQAIESNPIIQMISEVLPQEQSQAAPAAPTNFAGMVPPGGGMSVR